MYLNFDSKFGKFSKSLTNSKEAICGSVATSENNDMQSIDLSASFGKNTERTSFCTPSGCHIVDGQTDLHQQIADLNRMVADLKSTIQTKDFRIENIRRDNERLALELKKQQRCNRSLKQQLDDERFFYQKEKEHFCEEMQSRRTKCVGNTTKTQQQQRREYEKIRDIMEYENKQLKNEILGKNEVTYNLCIKFLRMKDSRDSFRHRLDRLLEEHLQVMAEMMEKLDEAREELNIIVSEKFQEPLPISKAKFLQVVQRNSKLVYENSTLKLQIQQLTNNIEKLKSNAQKPNTINVDARTIEKLTECTRRRRTVQSTRIFTDLSCSPNPDKSQLVSKSINPVGNPIVEHSSNAKMINAIKTKHRGKLTVADSSHFRANGSSDLSTDRTRSAGEFVQPSTFRQTQFSETPSSNTGCTKLSMEFHDVGTNP